MRGVQDRYGSQSARRRFGSAGVAVAVHVLVLGIALMSVNHAQTTRAQGIATFDVTDPGPPKPKPAKQPQPRKVPPTPPRPIIMPPPVELPTVSKMVVSLLEQADTEAGGGCDLTYPIQVALQTSPEVQQQLPSIPDSRRSVANALAMWNQIWVKPDQQLTKPVLEAIRTTVSTTIAAASPACREQPQGGPRLIYLTSNERTTVLALGSGEWTWQQVADSAQPDFTLPPELGPDAPANPISFASIAGSLF